MNIPRWLRAAINYWNDKNTFIFQSWVDALFGFIVLLVLPAISAINVITQVAFWDCATEIGWSNYTFPLTSICLAGLYDTQARYQARGEPQNLKLGIRAVLNITVLVLSGICVSSDNLFILLIPPGILCIAGCLLTLEAALLISFSIKTSRWYANLPD